MFIYSMLEYLCIDIPRSNLSIAALSPNTLAGRVFEVDTYALTNVRVNEKDMLAFIKVAAAVTDGVGISDPLVRNTTLAALFKHTNLPGVSDSITDLDIDDALEVRERPLAIVGTATTDIVHLIKRYVGVLRELHISHIWQTADVKSLALVTMHNMLRECCHAIGYPRVIKSLQENGITYQPDKNVIVYDQVTISM